jgi:hypothetical protein
MGVQQLTGVQIFKELTLGTSDDATAIVAGLTAVRHRDVPVIIRPPEFSGIMAREKRSIVVGHHGELHVEGYANVDDFNYFLGMTLRTPSESTDMGTPTATTRVYTPANTTVDTPDTYSLEIGDNTGYYLYNGTFGSGMQISGARDDIVRFSWDGMSKTGAETTKTAALSTRDIEPLAANSALLYIDDVGGTIGTTAYVGCMIGFQATLPGFSMFKCMDGTLYYTMIVQQPIAASMEVTLLVDATSRTLFSHAYQTALRQLVRLKLPGTSIHAGAWGRRVG